MLPISNPFYLNDPMIHITCCPKSILLLKCQTLFISWKDLLFHNSNNRLWTHLAGIQVKGNGEMNIAWTLHVYHHWRPILYVRHCCNLRKNVRYHDEISKSSSRLAISFQISCCKNHLTGWNQKNVCIKTLYSRGRFFLKSHALDFFYRY